MQIQTLLRQGPKTIQANKRAPWWILLGVVVKNWLLQWTVTYVKRHNILNALCKFPGELSKVEKDLNWLKDAEDSV